MKKIFLTGLFFLCFYYGCRKDGALPDYRDKYIGNYEFTTAHKYYGFGDTIPSIDTTIIHLGTVSYDRNIKGKISIFYLRNLEAYPEVDKDGNLSGDSKGKFDNNKVSFHRTVRGKGLGAGLSVYDVIGIKK